MELRQDYIELLENDIPASNTIPQEHVERLARIFSRDEDYLLAYLTVSLILDGNPGISMEKAAKLSLMLEPEVSDQIMEVVSSSMV